MGMSGPCPDLPPPDSSTAWSGVLVLDARRPHLWELKNKQGFPLIDSRRLTPAPAAPGLHPGAAGPSIALVFPSIRRWLAPPELDESNWRRLLDQVPLIRRLPQEYRGRVRALTARFLDDKYFDGAAGLTLTDAMRALIAVQACIPVCAMGYGGLKGWRGVVVYPGAFRVRHERVDPSGVRREERRSLSGEAWQTGPMVLSWDDVLRGARVPDDGENVVIHEIAHKLDMQNGAANGMPPLPAGMKRSAWTEALTAAYDDLRRRTAAGHPPLDPYAAESPAEFFAVLSEHFFEDPALLRGVYPLVYEQFSRFYALDPLGW